MHLTIQRSARLGIAATGTAIACLWYLDVLTTAWALGNGAWETGPFAKVLVERGYTTLLFAKGVGLSAILALAWLQVSQGRSNMALWSLAAIGTLSLAVVVWNLLSMLWLAGAI